MTECLVCGEPLTKPKTGRPPRYCSTTCRRSAEFSIKRLNAHLLQLEARRDHLRRRLQTDKLYASHRRDLERQVQALDSDCGRYQAELTALIGKGESQ
jgi:hypothetical protein